MTEEVMLSVIVATYGHERYIEQALRSILMQRTDFPYEVLIGEDYSPDGTAEALRRMEAELPDFFHIFYREQNLGEAGNNRDLQERARGKYIIFLEGDDYWIDAQKLQKQVDFLESHPDYIAVAHNTAVVDGEGNPEIGFEYPECRKEEYTLADFRDGLLAGQTATLMFRNIYRDQPFPLLTLAFPYPGDQQKNFMLAAWGRVYCIQEQMSAYRHVTSGGMSYSATHHADGEWRRKQVRACEAMRTYAEQEVRSRACVYYSETTYLKYLLYAVRERVNPEWTSRYFARQLLGCRCRIKSPAYIAGLLLRAIVKRMIGNGKERISRG